MSIFDHGPMLSKDYHHSRRVKPVPPAPVKRDLLQDAMRLEIAAWRQLYRARIARELEDLPPPPLPEAVALVELADGLIAGVFAKSLPQALAKDGLVENYRKPGTRRVVAGPRPCRKFGAR